MSDMHNYSSSIIDRQILARIRTFFANTPQTNWGKKQIVNKMTEIETVCIDDVVDAQHCREQLNKINERVEDIKKLTTTQHYAVHNKIQFYIDQIEEILNEPGSEPTKKG